MEYAQESWIRKKKKKKKEKKEVIRSFLLSEIVNINCFILFYILFYIFNIYIKYNAI